MLVETYAQLQTSRLFLFLDSGLPFDAPSKVFGAEDLARAVGGKVRGRNSRVEGRG